MQYFHLVMNIITAKNIEYGDSLSFLDENDDSHKIILQKQTTRYYTDTYFIHDIDSVYFEIRMDLSK